MAVINNCYNEAYRLLEENKEILDRISEYLFEKETITGKEFMKMYREMKGIPEPEDSANDKQEDLFVEEDVPVFAEEEKSRDEDTSVIDDYFEED